ncbi:MAG: hypothetical protein IIB00_05495 [candidate division Zixibacteria bacterium]|nr:hypothetical protein [candidate division Zixibacteria bacterium]
MKRITIVLVTSLALCLFGATAQASFPKISVSTPSPESKDTIIITVSGFLSTPCWNVTHTMTQNGNTFDYQIDVVAEDVVCIQIISAYSIVDTIIGLAPGEYLVTVDERMYPLFSPFILSHVEAKFIIRDNTGGGCLICIAGDVNLDGFVTIADPMYIIRYIFSIFVAPPQCPERWDIDGSGDTNIGDIIALLRYIFLNGAEPVCGP